MCLIQTEDYYFCKSGSVKLVLELQDPGMSICECCSSRRGSTVQRPDLIGEWCGPRGQLLMWVLRDQVALSPLLSCCLWQKAELIFSSLMSIRASPPYSEHLTAPPLLLPPMLLLCPILTWISTSCWKLSSFRFMRGLPIAGDVLLCNQAWIILIKDGERKESLMFLT